MGLASPPPPAQPDGAPSWFAEPAGQPTTLYPPYSVGVPTVSSQGSSPPLAPFVAKFIFI